MTKILMNPIMYPLRKLSAAFSMAAENLLGGNPSDDRKAYNSFRALGFEIQRLESLSPPRFETWQHPREGKKEILDWSETDLLRRQLANHGLLHVERNLDVLCMELTVSVLAEAATGPELAYRATQNSWTIPDHVAFLKKNLAKVDAMTDTVRTMTMDTVKYLIERGAETHQSRGLVRLSDAPSMQPRQFGPRSWL